MIGSGFRGGLRPGVRRWRLILHHVAGADVPGMSLLTSTVDEALIFSDTLPSISEIEAEYAELNELDCPIVWPVKAATFEIDST
jgi:hypothetical protein